MSMVAIKTETAVAQALFNMFSVPIDSKKPTRQERYASDLAEQSGRPV
jgi:hypothetical protein